MAEEVAPSFNALIRSLKKGESFAKAERYPLDDPPEDGMNSVLSRMRRTINAAVSKIREATGSNFKVESGLMITSDNEAMIATVVVTKN